jgi:hypothetical protein
LGGLVSFDDGIVVTSELLPPSNAYGTSSTLIAHPMRVGDIPQQITRWERIDQGNFPPYVYQVEWKR